MHKLTYWYCECIGDSDSYSIIAKTKKEAMEKRTQQGERHYEKPEKRVIDYRDAFDLFDWCTSEGGGRGCGSKS